MFQFGFPAEAAFWFLIPLVPIWLYVAFVDVTTLKIRNWVVIGIAALFVAGGPFVLDLGYYGIQLLQGAIVLAVMFGLFMLRAMGGGDAKFIAAAALYFDRSDAFMLLILLSFSFLGCFVLHRAAKASFGPRLFPNWASWHSGKRFPMGLPLGLWVVLYLAIAAGVL